MKKRRKNTINVRSNPIRLRSPTPNHRARKATLGRDQRKRAVDLLDRDLVAGPRGGHLRLSLHPLHTIAEVPPASFAPCVQFPGAGRAEGETAAEDAYEGGLFEPIDSVRSPLGEERRQQRHAVCGRRVDARSVAAEPLLDGLAAFVFASGGEEGWVTGSVGFEGREEIAEVGEPERHCVMKTIMMMMMLSFLLLLAFEQLRSDYSEAL